MRDTDLGLARMGRNRRGVYELRWTERDPDTGRARTRTYSCRTKDRAVALEVYRAWQTAGAAVGRLTVGVEVKTVREAVEKYLGAADTPASQRWALRALLHGKSGAALADTLVAALRDGKAFEAYRLARRNRDKVADGTVRRELGAVRAALNWCRSRGLVSEGVVGGLRVALPPEGPPRTGYLSEIDEARLWAAASGLYMSSGKSFRERRAGLFVCLALELAAREGAIRGLTWDRVDLVLGLVDFRDPGRAVTRKRRVPVPVSDRLKPVLAQAWAERSGPYVLGHGGAVRKGFEGLRGRVGGIDWLTIHDLRRTWASLRVQWGVPLEQVAGVLGDSLEVTQRHYAHLSPDFLRAAVNARGTLAA